MLQCGQKLNHPLRVHMQVELLITPRIFHPTLLQNMKVIGYYFVHAAPGVADGVTGIYTGNNGRVYRTVCINEYMYVADPLAETLYRDGTAIPEITDNTAWQNDTAGALCAYNNDWANV